MRSSSRREEAPVNAESDCDSGVRGGNGSDDDNGEECVGRQGTIATRETVLIVSYCDS
jgi:hypothetical protein